MDFPEKHRALLNLSLKNRKNLRTCLTYIFLMIFGTITAYILVKSSPLAHPLRHLDKYYMPLRVQWLDLLINDLKDTGFYTGLHRLYDHNASMYLYLSHLGNLLNLSSERIFFYTQLIFTSGLVATYPTIFYRITKNLPIALASIFFFLIYRPYGVFTLTDSYWIYSWITFLALPIFYFLFRDSWSKSSWLWSGVILIAISVSNVFRANAALTSSILLFIVISYKLIFPFYKKHKRVLISGVLFLCLIFTISFFNNLFIKTIPNIYQHATAQPKSLPTKGPWHSLYIGLGWEENPYGLYYEDSFGYIGKEELLFDITDSEYIGIESPEYQEAIKNTYIKTVLTDPVFFVSSYIRKFFKALSTAFHWTLLNPIFYPYRGFYFAGGFSVFILIVLSVYFFSIKKRANSITICSNVKQASAIVFSLAAFSAILGLLPGIVAYPLVWEYLFASSGSFDCVVLYVYILFISISINILKKIKVK